MPNPLAVDIADVFLGKKTLVGGQPGKQISMEEAFTTRVFPSAGTLLSYYCQGFTKVAVVANGHGGTYDVTAETDSNDCGYNKNYIDALRRFRHG